MHDLLRLMTWPPTSGPAGGCLCCPGSGVPDKQERNQEPVLPSIQTLKTTRDPTMWARTDRGIGQEHGVLLKKLPEVERGPAIKGTKRVQTSRCPATMEQDPKKEEEGHFHQKRPH